MRRLKNLFIALIAAVLLSPSLTFAHVHNSGHIEIKVLDQEGKDMSGSWFIYRGTGPGDVPLRNGSMGEVFRVYDQGSYFLVAQRKTGYEGFEITSANPQDMIPRGTITFTIVYTKETPYTPAETPDEAVEPEAPAEDEGGVMEEEEEGVAPEEEVLGELLEEEEETPRIPDRSLLPERTPLHVDPPAGSETAEAVPVSEPEGESSGMGGPLSLAQTGPGSLLALLALSGMGGYFSCIRRRRRV